MPNQSSKNQKNSPPDELAWKLDWNLLRTFMVIVQEKNITAAANRLKLKQPTVSNALKRLEQCLGCDLIRRGPRSFEVTARGKALYQECTSVFGTVNRLSCALEEAGEDISGTVQLSMASHVMSPLLDDTLEAFHRLHPRACISINISSSKDVIRSIFEKQSAIGICLVQDQVAELEYRHLYTEHFGFFCGPRHRLFGKQGLGIQDLRGEQCVSFRTDQLNDVLQPVALLRVQADFDRNIAGMSSNLEEIRRMVMAGVGIGALPVHVVEREVKDGLLFRLPPYENLPPINIWLVRHPGASLNQAEREFLRMLDERIDVTPIESRTYGNGYSPDKSMADQTH
jgi:DNA-binding transcriptional LysR family regulator